MEQKEKFYQLISETFAIDKDDIKDECVPDDIGNWTSITHMELIAKFDQEFGVNLDVDEVTEMDSIGRMKEILQKHGVNL